VRSNCAFAAGLLSRYVFISCDNSSYVFIPGLLSVPVTPVLLPEITGTVLFDHVPVTQLFHVTPFTQTTPPFTPELTVVSVHIVVLPPVVVLFTAGAPLIQSALAAVFLD
jgi:hypothetical protein